MVRPVTSVISPSRFIRSPDNISIEILQKGSALPQHEPWASMPNIGTW